MPGHGSAATILIGGGATKGATKLAGSAAKTTEKLATATKAVNILQKESKLVKMASKDASAVKGKIESGGAGSASKLKSEFEVTKPKIKNLPSELRQYQSKFKHAEVFGIEGNYTPKKAVQFEKEVQHHIKSTDTVAKVGTYRGDKAILHINESTQRIVIQKPDGSFWSAWKGSAEQVQNVKDRSKL